MVSALRASAPSRIHSPTIFILGLVLVIVVFADLLILHGTRSLLKANSPSPAPSADGTATAGSQAMPSAASPSTAPVPPIPSAGPIGSVPEATPSSPGASGTVRETVTFDVTARKFAFDPAEITVKKGQHVRLFVTALDVTHGFALPAFGVEEQVPAGKTVQVDFDADRVGQFEFYCAVYCGAGHGSMKGLVRVTE
jgi:cytochrome c oxidase subunit II